MNTKPIERCGVEIEYMLVDRDTLDVAPLADQILLALGVDRRGHLDRGEFSWSNELTKHILELKVSDPVSDFAGLHERMSDEILWMQDILESYDLRLLPTGMHPWMKPDEETELYPLSNLELYESYRRLFDWAGHGWANIQSTHLNFSFRNEDEFVRLHSAIRLLLPLLPALCASSPVVEGELGDDLDNRLEFYRQPSRHVPAMIGSVIPECIESRQDYEDKIYGPMRADLAIAEFVHHALRWLMEHNRRRPEVHEVPTSSLDQVYRHAVTLGMEASFVPVDLFPFYDLRSDRRYALSEILNHLLGKIPLSKSSRAVIELILTHGNLSQRIIRSLPNTSPRSLHKTYQRLADCLADNELFLPEVKTKTPEPEEPSRGFMALLQTFQRLPAGSQISS